MLANLSRLCTVLFHGENKQMNDFDEKNDNLGNELCLCSGISSARNCASQLNKRTFRNSTYMVHLLHLHPCTASVKDTRQCCIMHGGLTDSHGMDKRKTTENTSAGLLRQGQNGICSHQTRSLGSKYTRNVFAAGARPQTHVLAQGTCLVAANVFSPCMFTV